MRERSHRALPCVMVSGRHVRRKENGRTDGEPNTGDAVGDGADPGKLRLVDGKVWARRACETLRVQNHCAILWFERLCLNSAERKRVKVGTIENTEMLYRL